MRHAYAYGQRSILYGTCICYVYAIKNTHTKIAYKDPTVHAQPPWLGVGVLVRWGSLYAKTSERFKTRKKPLGVAFTECGFNRLKTAAHKCAQRDGALVGWKNCRRIAAVVVIWKFRSTFRPGNYMFRFSETFPMVLGSW